jgi:uncharacterized protein YjbJ (UPF0337 family)
MNWDQVEGKWKQFAGRFREKWGKLTDDDLQMISGKKDQLVGKIQERYGMAREQAQTEVDQYVSTLQAEGSATNDETQPMAGRARRAGQP